MKRCPNGTRRNKGTGLCEKTTHTPVPTTNKTRCAKGTRRNRKTQRCEKKKNDRNRISQPNIQSHLPTIMTHAPPSSPLQSTIDADEQTAFQVKFKRSFVTDDEFITFFSKSKDVRARMLSNFDIGTRGMVVYMNYDRIFPEMGDFSSYPTGEHAFQGAKFKILGHLSSEEGRKAALLAHSVNFESPTCKYPTASEAKSAGGKGKLSIRLTGQELATWESYCMIVQIHICESKLQQPEVRRFLVETKDKYLVHNERAIKWPRYGASVLSAANSPFQDGLRWMKGDNLLGIAWMQMRAIIQ